MIPLDNDFTEIAAPSNVEEAQLFSRIAQDLMEQGYSINLNALNHNLAQQLYQHQQDLAEAEYQSAAIGRNQSQMLNPSVRSDKISWISDQSEAEQAWLQWCARLQTYLNRRLFMGLFSFESHFARYQPGDFYKRHLDAFRGQSNRILTLVTYLNPQWQPQDGGEIVLYRDEADQDGIKILPTFGTLVIFLSEAFPHEVLPAKKERCSIAGWFRLNSSNGHQVDPPA